MILSFEEAKKQLQNGDILLFKGTPFPSFGFFICLYTGGLHSHAALAYKDNGNWMCLEQREFKGGRCVYLKSQVDQNPGRIDVYRASPSVLVPKFKDNWEWKKRIFGDRRKQNVIDYGKKLTGTPYGWKNIWKIARTFLPVVRLIHRKTDDNIPTDAYVCSTLVAAAYRHGYVDLCPNKPDERTTPADIERSALVNYLFTIDK
jgi:hypothetical protein